MKKKNHSISRWLPPLKIYLDDIEKIVGILKDEGFSDIKIETEDHQCNEQQIVELDEKEQISQIYSHQPLYISISFDDHARIYTGTNTALAQGIVVKLKNLLRKRVRKFFSLISKKWFSYSFLIIGQISAHWFRAVGLISEKYNWCLLL